MKKIPTYYEEKNVYTFEKPLMAKQASRKSTFSRFFRFLPFCYGWGLFASNVNITDKWWSCNYTGFRVRVHTQFSYYLKKKGEPICFIPKINDI